LRIRDLYRSVFKSYTPDDRSVSWPDPASVCPISKPWQGIVIGGEVVQLTIRSEDKPLLGRAKLRRVFDQSFENRLEIEGRAADDLEHVGGGRLLRQRFAQLIEEARVLDGDDGLGGEHLQQVLMFFRCGAGIRPGSNDRA
jgi:hypothetical protein